MIICETAFDQPDPKRPEISLHEVDYYGWIPVGMEREFGIPNHRLSLRKNMKTGNFELYRKIRATEEERVIYAIPDLSRAINQAVAEAKLFHGPDFQHPVDRACEHKPPNKDPFCKHDKREEGY